MITSQMATKKGYVYFIMECPATPEENFCFKIGESCNPIDRCKELQTANRRTLRIFQTLECPNKTYAKNLEGALHLYFLKKCLGGEWFSITPTDIDMAVRAHQYMRSADIPPEFLPEIIQSRKPLSKPLSKPDWCTGDVPFIPTHEMF